MPIVDPGAAFEKIVSMRVVHCFDVVDSPDAVPVRPVLQKAALGENGALKMVIAKEHDRIAFLVKQRRVNFEPSGLTSLALDCLRRRINRGPLVRKVLG